MRLGKNTRVYSGLFTRSHKVHSGLFTFYSGRLKGIQFEIHNSVRKYLELALEHSLAGIFCLARCQMHLGCNLE